MSNLLQYTIALRDQFSSGLGKVASSAGTIFGNMTRSTKPLLMNLDQIERRMQDLRKEIRFNTDLRAISAARRELEQLDRQARRINGGGSGSGGGGGVLGIASLAKGYLGYQGLQLAGSAVSSSIGTAMDMGTMKESFKVMAGSAQSGEQLTGDLKKFAAETVLGNGIFKNAQTMLSFGVEAKNIMPVMRMLGDISGGNQDKMDGLSLAFANTAAAGRLMGQDLLQYVNAGFNPLQEISRTTGKSMSQLRDEMSKGGISVQMVAEAMASATGPGGRFQGLMDKIAATAGGKWDRFKGQVGQIAEAFGNLLLPAISALLDKAGPFMDTMIGGLQQLGTWMRPIVDTYLVNFRSYLSELQPIFSAIMDVAGPLFNRIRQFITRTLEIMGPSIRNIAHAIGAVLGPAIRIVGPLLEWLFEKLGWWIEKLGWVFEKVTDILAWVADKAGWLMNKIAAVITDNATNIQRAVTEAVNNNQVTEFFKKAGEIHGDAYAETLMTRLRRAALWLDRFYNVNFFSAKLEETLKGKPAGNAPAKGASGAPYSFGTQSLEGSEVAGAKGAAKNKVDSLAGGGARNIYISLGKFMDNLNINTTSVKEGVNDMEEMVMNALLRVVNSANTMTAR